MILIPSRGGSEILSPRLFVDSAKSKRAKDELLVIDRMYELVKWLILS